GFNGASAWPCHSEVSAYTDDNGPYLSGVTRGGRRAGPPAAGSCSGRLVRQVGGHGVGGEVDGRLVAAVEVADDLSADRGLRQAVAAVACREEDPLALALAAADHRRLGRRDVQRPGPRAVQGDTLQLRVPLRHLFDGRPVPDVPHALLLGDALETDEETLVQPHGLEAGHR